MDMFCGINYETSTYMKERVTICNRSVLHEDIQDKCTILLIGRLSTDMCVCVCVCVCVCACVADVFEWLLASKNHPNP
jgi:hypothetical protein